MAPDLARPDENRNMTTLQQNPPATLEKTGRSNQVFVLMPLAFPIGYCDTTCPVTGHGVKHREEEWVHCALRAHFPDK